MADEWRIRHEHKHAECHRDTVVRQLLKARPDAAVVHV
jgi:hypothetical protein